MAFVKKTWVDRLSEFPGRRLLKKISGSADSEMVVDVVRSEGNVSREGDPYSAANMNDLEQRIADEFGSINNNLTAITDNGSIKGMDAREDGVYITYVPSTGADSVTKKLGEPTIKTQTINSGRLGNTGYNHTMVFNQLSKVSGIKSISARGYSSPSINTDSACSMSISNNKVTIALPYGHSYYEYICTAFEITN